MVKHPNQYLFELMSAFEDGLVKHLNSISVFEDTIDGLIFKFGKLTLSCEKHKDYILTYSIKSIYLLYV